MTSDAQKAKGWLIPTPITGYPLLCVKLQIPDVQEYRAAFLGAVYELTKWWNWQKSYVPGDTRAVQASSYMMESINAMTLGDCCDIQYRFVDCDVIEFSPDGGETWEEIADFTTCFVSLSPGTPTRNRVVPTATNVPNLDLFPILGQTAPLLSTGVFNVYPNNTLTGTDFMWSLGGAQLFGARYGLDVIMCWHPFFRHFIVGQKTIIGGYQGMPPSDSMLEVNIDSTTLKGIKIKAIAGQTYNMFENQKNDGTLYSGFDKIGQFFMSKISEPPSGNPGNLATFVYNTETDEIWYYIGISGGEPTWKRLLNTDDGEPILDVVYEDAPPGVSGSASLGEYGTLGIIFPAPSPVNPTPNWAVSARNHPLPDQSDSVTLTLLADGSVLLPWELQNGDTLQISNVVGWMNDGNVTPITQGYTGIGTDYFTHADSALVAGYIEAGYPPMALLCYYNTDFPGELLIGTDELLSGKTFDDVRLDAPYAIFMPNTLIVKLDYYMFGAIHFLATLTSAADEIVPCGESDFSTGTHGWRVKFAEEDPCIPVEEDCIADGAWDGDKFVPTNKSIIIIGYLSGIVSAPSITINYTVSAGGQQLFVVFGRRRAGGAWDTGGYAYIDTSVGTHDHTNTGDLGDYDALMVQIGVAGPEYGPIAYVLNKVTINCD